MLQKQKLKASVISAGLSMRDLAKNLGLNESTLYRKTNGSSDFTRSEIQKIQKILNLDIHMVDEIFFAK